MVRESVHICRSETGLVFMGFAVSALSPRTPQNGELVDDAHFTKVHVSLNSPIPQKFPQESSHVLLVLPAVVTHFFVQ